MFSLQELLGQQQGEAAVEQISENVGAEPSMVNSAIQAALPSILGALANNVQSPQGAESLNNALEQDDHASVLENLGGLGSMIFGQQDAPPPRQADAGGILDPRAATWHAARASGCVHMTGVMMFCKRSGDERRRRDF